MTLRLATIGRLAIAVLFLEIIAYVTMLVLAVSAVIIIPDILVEFLAFALITQVLVIALCFMWKSVK